MQEPQAHMNIYDARLWKRFWELTRMYWFSEEKWKARGLLALLLALLCAFSSISIIFSYVNRDLMSALQEKDLPGFYHGLFLIGLAIAFSTPVTAYFNFYQQKMAIHWRLWLTDHFLGKYFENRAYYHINSDNDIDNPDQRISSDLHSFVHNTLSLILILFHSLVQFFSFAWILWSISQKLVVVLLGYAIAGTVISIALGRRLLNLNFQQTRKEADFRYGLVHIRDNVESIAFYQGEAREGKQVRQRLQSAVDNNLALVTWERNLAFFTTGYNYIPMLLPFVVLAPNFFSGDIKLGVLTQAAGAFSSVLTALAVIVTNFSMLSSFAAGITRLEAFATRLDRQSTNNNPGTTPVIASQEGQRLAIEKVTLQTPDCLQTLLMDATAEVPPGKGLLIAGASGLGKSSLLRAIAGLWNTGEGKIIRPPFQEMLFLPQRPYMILGSLREQLLYPIQERDISDTELGDVLHKVNLADLPKRFGGFDAVMDWRHLLSLGEQQRMAFARLLLCNPRYAVLDEATSALDVENEARLYEHLRQADMTYISVGHRPSLITYHEYVLELLGKGTWRFIPAEEFAATG